MKFLESILKAYAYLFGKRIFRRFNEFLFHLSLRGLGILNSQNDYLMGEKDWLNKYLKNKVKPVVIDVGANKGLYSSFVLDSNRDSVIFAFEPHPVTYNILRNNIINSHIKLYNLAVGSDDGLLELYDFDTNDGSQHASLYKDVITDLHRGKAIAHSVKVIKLDNFIINQNIDIIDLLKIDTEGNEFNVLLGCSQFLKDRKIKAIHFEFNEMNIVSKVSFKDFWDYLKEYELYRILPGGNLLRIESYKPKTCEIYAFQNIVAILKSK